MSSKNGYHLRFTVVQKNDLLSVSQFGGMSWVYQHKPYPGQRKPLEEWTKTDLEHEAMRIITGFDALFNETNPAICTVTLEHAETHIPKYTVDITENDYMSPKSVAYATKLKNLSRA